MSLPPVPMGRVLADLFNGKQLEPSAENEHLWIMNATPDDGRTFIEWLDQHGAPVEHWSARGTESSGCK